VDILLLSLLSASPPLSLVLFPPKSLEMDLPMDRCSLVLLLRSSVDAEFLSCGLFSNENEENESNDDDDGNGGGDGKGECDGECNVGDDDRDDDDEDDDDEVDVDNRMEGR
jgi:hypothetical protein